MNGLFKYFILSTLVLAIMSNASAVFQDLNVWDENGARHANRGEDFNIMIKTAMSTEISTDYNYLVALSYGTRDGTTYVDLNVNVLAGTGGLAGLNNIAGDGNVVMKTLAATSGTACGSGGDVNVLVLSKELDNNTFNITVTVPSSGDINTLVGHSVAVELWRLEDLGGTTRCTGSSYDANTTFIIGPAIILAPKAGGSGPGIGSIDGNIAVVGYGFNPDLNVSIRFADANGVVTADLNIRDVNYSFKDEPNLFDAVYTSAVGEAQLSKDLFSPYRGIKVVPDSNGDFDINVMLPPVPGASMAGPGGAPDNNINASNGIDDANAQVITTPGITMSTDENVTVGICNISGTSSNRTDTNCAASSGTFSRVSVETAMKNNWIGNMEAVKNFQVQMCDGSCASGAPVLVQVAFNSDMNMSKGPQRNYDRDMNAAQGKAKMDTDQMPEFAIDANIFMYNVKTPSSTMPLLAKDGIVCPSTTCKNQDGTDLSEAKAWSYNAAAGDGNISFRVNTFSEYTTGTLTVEMVAPNGGEKIRVPRYGADTNYTIQFKFKDLNAQDDNFSRIGDTPMHALLYYSVTSGAKTGVIINDTNLFDHIGIRCNGYADMVSDTNMSNWVNCVFDLNRSDLNGIVGEFKVDVNVTGPIGISGVAERSVIGSTDQNLFFNPPLIEITDANLNTVSHFQINPRTGVADINYIIDFNIYLPDINRDQNFTLADYNIHFYLGATQTSLAIGSGASDLNVLGISQQFDQNFQAIGEGWDTNSGLSDFNGVNIQCISPPDTAPYLDYKCTLQYDANGVFENKSYIIAKIVNNKVRSLGHTTPYGSTYIGIDTNELWDVNASTLSVSINDNKAPRARFSSSYGTTSPIINGASYNMTLSCDDNTSGASNYFVKKAGESWSDTSGNPVTAHTPNNTKEEIVTYYGGCLDYAGNTSDMNATLILTFRPQGSGGTTPTDTGGSGGASGPATEGTETIVLVEIHGAPEASAVKSVLSEAGFTGQEIANAMQLATNTAIDQKIAVDKITTATGSTYRTAVSIKVTNHSAKKWKNVKVIAEIPKALATSAALVSSNTNMRTLKEDPIIEFTVPEIQVGESAEIIYYISKSISDVTAKAVPLGMVTAYIQTEPCEGVACESTACATGTCNNTTGRCDYVYEANGTGCGVNKECKAGTCIEKAAPATPPAQPPAQPAAADYTIPIIVVVIIILVVIGAAYYTKKGKRKGR